MFDIRRILRRVHRWLGLGLSVPVAMLGVTGAILTIAPVFDDIGGPAASTAAGPPHAPAEIIARAQQDLPPGLRLGRLHLGSDPRDIATAELTRPPRRQAEVALRIDPVTLGIVARQEMPGQFIGVVHRLHESALLPGPLGRTVIGWFGIGLFATGLAGIVVWWPPLGQLKAALRVSARSRGLRFQRELHGAAGIWVGAMLLLQSVSGAALAFPQTVRGLLGVPAIGTARSTEASGPPDVAAAIANAQARLPRAMLRDIVLPAEPGRSLLLRYQPGDVAEADSTMWALAVTDAAGHVLSVQDPRAGSVGARILANLRMLHYGQGAGLMFRGVAALAGLALPLFAVTGVWMWLLRRRNRLRLQRLSMTMTIPVTMPMTSGETGNRMRASCDTR